jgi:hypothetical protein
MRIGRQEGDGGKFATAEAETLVHQGHTLQISPTPIEWVGVSRPGLQLIVVVEGERASERTRSGEQELGSRISSAQLRRDNKGVEVVAHEDPCHGHQAAVPAAMVPECWW